MCFGIGDECFQDWLDHARTQMFGMPQPMQQELYRFVAFDGLLEALGFYSVSPCHKMNGGEKIES